MRFELLPIDEKIKIQYFNTFAFLKILLSRLYVFPTFPALSINLYSQMQGNPLEFIETDFLNGISDQGEV